MESFTKFFCDEAMMSTTESIMENLSVMRKKSNRTSVASVLKKLAQKSEAFCANGPKKYGELDMRNKKTTVQLRAYYLALGGIICRLTGDDAKSREELQSIVDGKTYYLDLAGRIIESVSRKCPTWFSTLPVLTLYWLILFVVDTELKWAQECLPNPPEESLQEALNHMDHEDSLRNMKTFQSSYTKVFKSFHSKTERYWKEEFTTQLGAPADLPEKLQSCFSQTISFVAEMDKIFSYAVYRNDALMEQVRKGWNSGVKVSNTGEFSLTVPDSGIQMFHFPCKTFMLHLILLLDFNNKKAQGIITELAICQHLRSEDESDPLSSHGYKNGNHNFVRSVGLQIDICNIWNTIRQESKAIIQYYKERYSLLPVENSAADYLTRAECSSQVRNIRDDFHKITMAILLLSAVAQDEVHLYSKLVSEFL